MPGGSRDSPALLPRSGDRCRTPLSVRLLFRRDDDPRVRRRAERTVERLRTGGPVLADDELTAPVGASAGAQRLNRHPRPGAVRDQ
ncbi:hypothetical protein AB0C13_16870 [Streptomyces sp. NPDC049099]|uniref:hypothetical protein n=1 Tax=Streptomyces sp. NPDC049099 TaxID=3155768 RepID=UPI00342E316F